MTNRLMLLLFAGIITLAACTNEDDMMPDTPSVDELTTTAGWFISFFFDKDEDETDDFAGYTFFFRENGAFEAVRNGETQTGTWQLDDSSNKLIINISGFQPLDELNDDWRILEWTGNRLELQEDNEEHEEILHFQRR